MKRLGRIFDATARAAALLGAIAIMLMMAHVAVDVVARKVFGRPLPGTLAAVTHYYMVIAVFAPLALVERGRGHISVDVVEAMLPARARRWLDGLTRLAAALAMAMVAWRGWVESVRDWEIGAAQVQGGDLLPVWPSHFIVPLGAGLMAIALLLSAASALTRGRGPSP